MKKFNTVRQAPITSNDYFCHERQRNIENESLFCDDPMYICMANDEALYETSIGIRIEEYDLDYFRLKTVE